MGQKTMYEFMQKTVIECAFMLIVFIDIMGIGYCISGFVKWLKKKIHKADTDGTGTAETE